MMNNRPTRGPRLFNARVALVAILSIVAFGGSFAILGPVASGSTVYVATAEISAGDRVEAGSFTATQIKGDFPDSFVIGKAEFDAMLGKIVLANLRAGDLLRDSDVFTPTDGNIADGARITTLLAGGTGRVVVVLGDPTTTFAQPGDLLDIYAVTGNDEDAVVSFCFSKKILYTVPRTIPAGEDADGFVPEGTAFVVDINAAEAAVLITAQERGRVRVALGSPEGEPVSGNCSAFGGVIPGPTPEPTPEPTEEPAPTVLP